jgi:hypothetical protein
VGFRVNRDAVEPAGFLLRIGGVNGALGSCGTLSKGFATRNDEENSTKQTSAFSLRKPPIFNPIFINHAPELDLQSSAPTVSFCAA